MKKIKISFNISRRFSRNFCSIQVVKSFKTGSERNSWYLLLVFSFLFHIEDVFNFILYTYFFQFFFFAFLKHLFTFSSVSFSFIAKVVSITRWINFYDRYKKVKKIRDKRGIYCYYIINKKGIPKNIPRGKLIYFVLCLVKFAGKGCEFLRIPQAKVKENRSINLVFHTDRWKFYVEEMEIFFTLDWIK